MKESKEFPYQPARDEREPTPLYFSEATLRQMGRAINHAQGLDDEVITPPTVETPDTDTTPQQSVDRGTY